MNMMNADLNDAAEELTGNDEMDSRDQYSGYKHSSITDQIIKAYYKVYNTLGYGFLERVYENAMVHELQEMGLSVSSQHPISVMYDDVEVGTYFADLLVEDLVVVELKAAEELCIEHELQLVNYLKATDKEIGLLLNFGRKPKIKRKVFSNSYLR